MSQLMTLPPLVTQEDFTEFVFSDILRSILQKPVYESVEQPEHRTQEQQINETVERVGYESQHIVQEIVSQDSTDTSLVEQAASGNERAFELLVHRYEALVLHFVNHHLAYSEDAQDIVQFVFLQLYLFLPRLRGHLVSTRSQQPLKSWLLQVARNRCRDERRKKHPFLFSELETVTEEENNPLEYIPDTTPLPEEFIEEQDQRRLLQDAIQALPSRYHSIVSLRYQEELTFREIGQRLHMPENTAKTYFQRARPLLRSALALQMEESYR